MADQIGSQNNPVKVSDPSEKQPIPVLASLPSEQLDSIEASNRNAIAGLNEIQSDSWSDSDWKLYNAASTNIKAVQEAKAAKISGDCISKQTDKGYSLSDSEKCEAFVNSTAFKQARQLQSEPIPLPDVCGTSELAGINTELTKFFQKLKAIKQWGELYINGTINKISKVTNLIRNTSSIIAAILKILIQRLRNFLIGKIRAGIQDLIDMLLPTVAKAIKNTIIQKIIDTIFCKFKEIASGLAKMVADFLFALIGKAFNIPFCAATQWTNALINKLAAGIDNALGPILDQINDVLGGVTKIVGSVFQALDFILGFESFLCAKPNCPQVKDFKADPFWGGPTQKDIDNFNNFLPVPDESDLIEGVTGWTRDLPIFGGTLGQFDATIPDSITQCDIGAYRCGPPIIQIFGGGGTGAVANAVIDTVGQIVGFDLIFGGSGYETPPFVSVIDGCRNGDYASAYSEINDDGEVVNIIVVTPGNGYIQEPNGLDEFDQPVTGTDGTNATGQVRNAIRDYVVCLTGFEILSTGIGYKPTDTVELTPNIPGLQANIKLTESGQILDIQLQNKVCGLTEIPDLIINSDIGAGVEVRPKFDIIRINETNPLDPRSVQTGPTTTGVTESVENQSPTISIDAISKKIINTELVANENQLSAIIKSGSRVGKANIIRIVDCVT
jgi:hypothetical protein